MRMFNDLWRKFQRAAYRKAFVGAEIKRVIPFQISAIRKARGWSQGDLARRSGLTQGVISRAEDPDYGNLTFNTVIRIANGFDVAFVGKFIPYSELAHWYSSMSEASVGNVPDFDTENGAVTELIYTALAPTAPLRVEDLMDYLGRFNQQQGEEEPERIGPLAIGLRGGSVHGSHIYTNR